LLLHGEPIAHLSTTRLFAYAEHFDAHPFALEWIDDTTAIFVFSSKMAARAAWQALQKSSIDGTDAMGFVVAKPIPISCWPPEDLINRSLGKGEGLKGAIKMRYAKTDDVKKKGAKKESQFYKKHGESAGKGGFADGFAKRRKQGTGDDDEQRAQLDDELDGFLSEEPESKVPPSPPSKMYSDYIGKDGRTLLERTSVIRAHPTALESRITSPLPHRRRVRPERNGNSGGVQVGNGMDEDRSEGRHLGRGGYGGRGARPKKTQQELDDELEAFLDDRD
jgi:Nuclear cap-binding protein subunit 3